MMMTIMTMLLLLLLLLLLFLLLVYRGSCSLIDPRPKRVKPREVPDPGLA